MIPKNFKIPNNIIGCTAHPPGIPAAILPRDALDFSADGAASS
jgi:hypothetical protein